MSPEGRSDRPETKAVIKFYGEIPLADLPGVEYSSRFYFVRVLCVPNPRLPPSYRPSAQGLEYGDRCNRESSLPFSRSPNTRDFLYLYLTGRSSPINSGGGYRREGRAKPVAHARRFTRDCTRGEHAGEFRARIHAETSVKDAESRQPVGPGLIGGSVTA